MGFSTRTALIFCKMGGFMSSMEDFATARMLNLVTERLLEKDIKNFEQLHVTVLDIFNTVNTSLPGKHYDAPSREEVEARFKQWQSANDSDKKTLFMDFMKEKLNLSKVDNPTLYTGLIAPPAAMAAKRAGESLPQLKLIKSIPDVLFVPSATMLALISVKISRKMFLGQKAS